MIRLKGNPLTSPLKLNILANFLGRFWGSFLNLLLVPFYIRFLGIEAYGLIGFYFSLTVMLMVLDMGLTATILRLLAFLSGQEEREELERAQEARDLVRTFEIFTWVLALIVTLVLTSLSTWIAENWLNSEGLSKREVARAVFLMGIVIGLQWPGSFYSGGLMGLQRQVLVNLIRFFLVTIQGLGALLVLWLIAPSIEAFFTWQVVVSAGLTVTFWYALWKVLPAAPKRARFRIAIWKEHWRFSLGMAGIAALAAVLTQMDKLILSRLLSLEVFAYYALTNMVGTFLVNLVGPIYTALFPRFSQLVGSEDGPGLAKVYHQGCQLVSLVILPLGFVLGFFAEDLLSVWLRDPDTVRNSHSLLSVLVIGFAFNAIMTLPYGLQLAHGWTRLSIYKNLIAVALLIPLLLWIVPRFGAIGAAFVWVALNTGYFLFEVPIMHGRILSGEKWGWYLVDVGRAMLVCLLIVGAMRMLKPESDSLVLQLGIPIIAGALALAATAYVLPRVRREIRHYRQVLRGAG